MEFKSLIFYIFSTILVLASLRVITARNPVHAALFLVLAFFSASCLWMLLSAEFLAITLILVYIGAVMVLFLFVVMMLDINSDSFREGFWQHFPLAALVGAVIAVEIGLVMFSSFDVGVAPVDPALAKLGNTKMLGIELYTNYLYPLQVAAVILLVAIIAAIALTLRRRKDSRAMDPGEQVKARKADRVRLVKMAPVTGSEAAPARGPGEA
jgi:NADH-quinone oxidoreductase subunit J